MISRALSTSASPSSSRRGRIVRARLYSVQTGWPKPCQSAPAETARSPSSGCRTGSWAQISIRCPGKRPPTLPPRRLCQSTLCRKTAPAVSACLTITTSTTKHAQARARVKQFRMLGPIFFYRGQKRMTSQASMWKLGEVRSNAKGGKFLCLEPLFWQSEASLEIPWEPRAFSEGQRPSVSFATDERARLFWERAETDLVEAAGGRIRARLRRKAHARGCAPAAAASL